MELEQSSTLLWRLISKGSTKPRVLIAWRKTGNSQWEPPRERAYDEALKVRRPFSHHRLTS